MDDDSAGDSSEEELGFDIGELANFQGMDAQALQALQAMIGGDPAALEALQQLLRGWLFFLLFLFFSLIFIFFHSPLSRPTRSSQRSCSCE